MATISPTPPQAPRWRFEFDEAERGYLLAALDFARSFLTTGLWSDLTGNWPLPAEHYAREIGQLEQVVASVSLKDLAGNA